MVLHGLEEAAGGSDRGIEPCQVNQQMDNIGGHD